MSELWGSSELKELQVYARPRFLQAQREFLGGVPHGMKLSEVVNEVYRRGNVIEPLRHGTIVQINGDVIPREQWDIIQPGAASEVVVNIAPMGGGNGKNPIAIVLSLAVIIAAPYLGGLVAVAAGFEAAGTAAAMFTAGIGMIGMMAVNALFPPRTSLPSTQSYNDSPTYSISGAQNDVRKFETIPVVLGRHKQTPPLGTLTFTELVGNDEYFRMLVVWGYGPLKIENIKIGTTPIEEYDDVQIETREGRDSDAPITLITEPVLQDSIGVVLKNADGWVVRRSKTEANELSVDIAFLQGLVDSSGGSRRSRTVTVEMQYRRVGSSSWTPLEPFVVTDNFVGSLRKGRRWSVAPAGEYEIGMRRATADTDSDMINDEVTWTYLRTFRMTKPITFPKNLAMTALRIKGTEQLQGVISQLNAICTSYGPVWNGSEWTGEAPTQNPASLVRLVLMGPANEQPRSSNQVQDANLGAFYEFCAANGYKFNMVRDFVAGVWDTVADICGAARAAPTIIDGKWGVVVDSQDKPIAQHFTPRNSWGFKCKTKFFRAPHALRVKFRDEENDFETDERIVYADGYDASTATQFESLEFAGVTDRVNVWKHGRYHQAQAKLRPRTYTFNTDFEHFRCQRGDLIKVSHDVMMWGLGSARVKALIVDESGATTGIVLDDKVTMVAGKTYGCEFRLDNGGEVISTIQTEVGETDTLHFEVPLFASQTLKVGDLGSFGIAGRVTTKLLVKVVRPGADLTAEFECVDYAPEIYNADTGEIPPFNPNVTVPMSPITLSPAPPIIVNVDSGTAALEKTIGGIKARILVSLQAGISSVRVGKYSVRYRLSGSTDWRYVEQPSEQSVVSLPDVLDGETYVMQARAISIYGVPSGWTEDRNETVVGQSQRPANVVGYRVNVINGIAYHEVTASAELDISHIQIRWNREKDGAKWGGSIIVIEKMKGTAATSQALDGTYLAKAFDLSGNESASAAICVNNSGGLANMNYVASIDQQSPNFTGIGDGVVFDAGHGGLVLDAGVYEGTFTFSDILDLGGIFTALATASISSTNANLTNDLYAYADLFAAGDLYGVSEGQTSVSFEMIHTADDTTSSPIWAEWQTLLVGEYSRRGYRARVRLKRSDFSVTPVVSRACLQLDMKDRVFRFNQTLPVGGARVPISPPFFAVPEIPTPNVLGGQEGDWCSITNITKDGFDANITNGGNNVGPRTISGAAFSYGEAVA